MTSNDTRPISWPISLSTSARQRPGAGAVREVAVRQPAARPPSMVVVTGAPTALPS